MKLRIGAILLATTLGAMPLTAQSPFEQWFQLQGIRSNDPIISVNTGSATFNAYSSPYVGALAPLAAPNSFQQFLVWCVDELHESYINQTYEAWLTPLTSGDYSHTRMGIADKDEYIWAAYLASSMNLNWAVSANQQQSVALQDAMWALLGEGANASTRLSTFESSSLATSLGISSTTNFATTTPSGFDPTGWALITCDPGVGNSVSTCGAQEFLVQVQSGSITAITPEPASLSLLATGMVGIGGAAFRRRKRSNR